MTYVSNLVSCGGLVGDTWVFDASHSWRCWSSRTFREEKIARPLPGHSWLRKLLSSLADWNLGQLFVPLVKHALAIIGLLKTWMSGSFEWQLRTMARLRCRVVTGRARRQPKGIGCFAQQKDSCSCGLSFDFCPVVLIILPGCSQNTPISHPVKESLWDCLKYSLFQVKIS